MEKIVVKDFNEGPHFHLADPKETNTALCGASTVPHAAPPAWGVKQAQVGETFCAKCTRISQKGVSTKRGSKKGKKKR